MSKSKRQPEEMPVHEDFDPSTDGPSQPLPEPAPKPRQNHAKELATLKAEVAKVLEWIDLAEDIELALTPENKAALYQKAIAKLRGLV